MTLTAELLPLWLAIPAWVAFLGLWGWSLLAAPWRLLRANGIELLFVLATGLLAGLWWLKAGAHDGLEFHLLGLTTMVLIFGWRLAVAGGGLALLLLAIIGGYDWISLGGNGLLGVVLPASLAHGLHSLVYRRLPRHFFVYALVSAHFTSMLVIAAVVIAGGLLLALLGAHPWDRVLTEYFLFLPLVMVPEGFLNGAIMTTLIILRPEWVRSFDDVDYIDGK